MIRGATRGEVEAALARHPQSKRAIDQMVQDIVSTLGWTLREAEDFVIEEAGVILGAIAQVGFEVQVMENVQQRMHDEFIDTSWPECPAHGGHPMWLSEESPWVWSCRGAEIPLGQLPGAVAKNRPRPHPGQSPEPDWGHGPEQPQGHEATW